MADSRAHQAQLAAAGLIARCAATEGGARRQAERAAAALWFTLDEIGAVARCIPLVLEHVGEDDRAAQIDALARAVAALQASATEIVNDLERGQRAAPA